jgi:hypothetical protein
MEHKSIDITHINDIAPSMKAYYLREYICDHIDIMPAYEIRKVILKHYHVNDLFPIKVAFFEVAMEMGVNFYRNKGNLELTAEFLKAKEFDDEIIADVIKRIGKYIRHAEANLSELYFKQFFPGFVSIVFLSFVIELFSKRPVEYYEYELLFLYYLAIFVVGSIAFILTWYTKRKTSRRILGL